MSVLTCPLPASEVQKAKPGATDYKLFDARGCPCLSESAAKIWRFRYKRPGSVSRTTIIPGYFPAMSLASARHLPELTHRVQMTSLSPMTSLLLQAGA